jgi:hypothetical protein
MEPAKDFSRRLQLMDLLVRNSAKQAALMEEEGKLRQELHDLGSLSDAQGKSK